MLLLSSVGFYRNNSFKKILQEHYPSVKWFGSEQYWRTVHPDLGPDCLQRLSADDKSL